MSIPFQMTINPQPASLAVANNVSQMVFALHAMTPLAKVVFTQDLSKPSDLHNFQVYTQDARAWIDIVDGTVGGHRASPKPSLTRGQVSVGEWTWDEWNAIQALRLALYNLHRALHETSLIQFLFIDGDVIVDATPTTANVGHLDWIGLFEVGAPNSSYLAFYTIPDGDTDDMHAFPTPADPGSYEFRYLVANGYTDIARSNPVVVS